jgi:hypothetical protein
MSGHPAPPASPADSLLRHPFTSLSAQIQTQAMSHAKFVFLIALVVFFVALFVVAYVWMRRPEFGQKGGRPKPTPSGGTVAAAARRVPTEPRSHGEVVLVDGGPRMPEGS